MYVYRARDKQTDEYWVLSYTNRTVFMTISALKSAWKNKKGRKFGDQDEFEIVKFKLVEVSDDRES